MKPVVGDDLPGFSLSDDEWVYLPVSAYHVEKLFDALSISEKQLPEGLTKDQVLESENPVILKFRVL